MKPEKGLSGAECCGEDKTSNMVVVFLMLHITEQKQQVTYHRERGQGCKNDEEQLRV
jgi:hypothetical protein